MSAPRSDLRRNRTPDPSPAPGVHELRHLRTGESPGSLGANERPRPADAGPPPAIPAAGDNSPAGRLLRLDPFDPGRRGVRALAVVAGVAVLVAAVFAWRARPEVEPAVPTLAGLPSAAAGDLPAPSVTAPAAAEVVVAVTGKVNRPGLIRLPAGARVADAVKAAGGIAPGAPVTYLNLARKLVDGELIVVGISAPPPADPAGPGAPGAGESPTEAGGAVNLNSATAAQLDALPGVGPVLAERIVEHRQRHGAFRSVADLRRVDGIGATRFERLKALVTV